MLDENDIIEKSRNIVAMECLDNLGLQELKILDVYLSRINPRDKSTREVKFTKREYEKLLKVEKLQVSRLDEYVSHLMHNEVKIPTQIDKKILIKKHILFPDASLVKEGGEWSVYLEINPKLDPFFFDIKNLGYIKYRLRYTIKLQSKYDVKIYLFLKTFEYDSKKIFSVSLEKFKERIECNKPTYNTFKLFNSRILKPSIQRINDFTDLDVSYKKPRKNSYEDEYIEFTVSRKVKLEVKEPPELEVKELQPTLYNIPSDVIESEDMAVTFLELKIRKAYPDADESKIEQILKVANIKYNPAKVKANPYMYYQGIVENILAEMVKPVEDKVKPNKFHNFDQREDDIDALIRQLNN